VACQIRATSVTLNDFHGHSHIAIISIFLCRIAHTSYVYAVYCYRPSSVVCLDSWSVCRSVTLVSRAKTAEPIEMPFGLWGRRGPRKRVRWGPDPPLEGAI